MITNKEKELESHNNIVYLQVIHEYLQDYKFFRGNGKN